MKSRFQKCVVSTPAPKKAPKHFIYVNLPADQQKEMRAMAHELGSDLRTCLHNAVGGARRAMIEQLKLVRRTGLDRDAAFRLVGSNPRN